MLNNNMKCINEMFYRMLECSSQDKKERDLRCGFQVLLLLTHSEFFSPWQLSPENPDSNPWHIDELEVSC